MRAAVRPVFLGVLLGLASCGSISADSGEASLPFSEAPATTQPSPERSDTSQSTETSLVIPELKITAEMLEGMLATEQGRTLILQGLADQSGLSLHDAACFVDALSLETMVGLSILQSPESELDLNPEQQLELSTALDACELTLEALRP